MAPPPHIAPPLPVHTRAHHGSLPLSPNSSTHQKLFTTITSSNRRSKRHRLKKLQGLLLAALAAVTLIGLVLSSRSLKRHFQDTFSKAYYGLDARMLGRRQLDFPVRRCCESETCLRANRQRHALVTYIRTDAYLPLLKQLECTARRSNPWLPIAVMIVPGELSQAVFKEVESMNVTLIQVKGLEYQNDYETRYSWNWLKIRAFGLTQYDAILLMDSDAILVGNVRSLFDLPTDFAAVWDQSKWMNRHKTILQSINGGVLFIRPCNYTEQEMTRLLSNTPKLRFSHGTAEQDFFAWYFKYTMITLPLEYNTMASESLEGDLTVGGVQPRIVHFTHDKPFHGPERGKAGHKYLCKLT